MHRVKPASAMHTVLVYTSNKQIARHIRTLEDDYIVKMHILVVPLA